MCTSSEERLALDVELSDIENRLNLDDNNTQYKLLTERRKQFIERRGEIVGLIYNYDNVRIDTHNWKHIQMWRFKCKNCGITGESEALGATRPFKLHAPYLSCNEMIMRDVL